jgi:hypothetical protein
MDSEDRLIALTEHYGVDALQSAYFKLELGIATSEEQIAMCEFIKVLRDLLKEVNDYND